MLGKIKTIANIGSVIMSAILVGFQVVGLVKNGKSNPVDTPSGQDSAIFC